MKPFLNQLVDRVAEFERWDRLARGTGYCSHPIRLSGSVDEVDTRSGELFPAYSTAGEPDGSLLVACGNRRSSRCPSCSAVYRSDTWQLVAAGLRGGKGVPSSVVDHPRLFVTLTAPSFGAVHGRRGKGKRAKVCHNRKGRCPHGVSRRCPVKHSSSDPLLGTPLCAECFDYERAVLWNAVAPELWRRTTIYLRRTLARLVDLTPTALAREVRVTYTKVAEYQQRGAIHFHAVIRLDGADPSLLVPPSRGYDVELLVKAVHEAVDKVSAPLPDDRGFAVWGKQLDVRVIRQGSESHNPLAIAAYVAKYATKGSDAIAPGLDRRLEASDVAGLSANDHIRRLVATCWRLGSLEEFVDLKLRKWAHALGFRGHFSTRSRRYSVTLTSLRRARAEWARARRDRRTPLPDRERVGRWQLVGIGYRNEVDYWLAAAGRERVTQAAEQARELRRKERELVLAA